MNLLEQLRGNFPKTIDKSKPVFSWMVANDNKTGRIQYELDYLMSYMKEWISTPDVYEQTGVMLEKTISFFSFLERFADESEQSLKNRFGAIFVRNHDTRWGTAYDVKSVFKQYFPHATIYVVENTNKIDDSSPTLANLFTDGDINTDTPTAWTLTNCSACSFARFSKAYGIEMNLANAALTEANAISVSAETPYFLHFFMKGECDVVIEDNNGKFYDYENKTWEDSEVKNYFSTAKKDSNGNVLSYDWKNCSMYFITNASAETVTITFKMKGSGQKVHADVNFTLANAAAEDVIIPSGTRVSNSDESLVFVTTEDARIAKNQTTSNLVNAEAENFGLSYITAENTITKDLDDLSVTVDNPQRSSGGTYLDYFRLFQKQPYGSFTVIAHFDGNSSVGVFGLAPGEDDPDPLPQPKYSRYGYYDKSFLSGVPIGFATDIYEDLLDYLRAQGVRAYLEIVVRDYSGE